MYCINCGKQIDNSASICPYCGTLTNGRRAEQDYEHTPVRQNFAQSRPNNIMAIVGFVLSFLFSPAGLTLCIIAKSKNDQMDSTGRGLATAGIVISIISMVFFILSFIYIITLMGMIAAILT